jgi:4-hydroxy-tetrahydrodipicolinate synthase
MSESRRSFLAGIAAAGFAGQEVRAAPARNPRFFVAALTLMDRNGRFDQALSRDLLSMLRDKGADGIVVMGTTGEFSSFTVAERREVLESMMKAKGKLDVFCHVGCSNLPDTLELLAHASETGAEAALVVPPFYYKNPKIDGLDRYYTAVLDAARIPVLLYHIPNSSGVPITSELVQRLAKHERLYGIKDSSGNLETLLAFLKDFPKLNVFTGSPRLISTALQHGGAGAITGNGNVIPAQTAAVFNAFRTGKDLSQAQERLDKAVGIAGGDLPSLKFMLGELGLRPSYCRPPFASLTATDQASLKSKVATLNELR